MDNLKAQAWETQLKGKDVAGWRVVSLIDNGKSAAVFRAEGLSGTVALKIFDDEIIERYGDKTQLQRIDRELTLVGKKHPNMVGILGGGVDATTGNHFIVMDYLNGPSLQKCLREVPAGNVPKLIEQLASACSFLEGLGLAHRDIKPANIALIDDYERLVLLDFGVLKPIGQPGPTDADGGRIFIGTLQYSSPEFLMREEEDTTEAWRALSFYQIGGVLHDLIMRRPLFHDFVNPYAQLVNAVQYETPSLTSTTLPSYLVDACRMALIKDPLKRRQLVGWHSFSPPPPMNAAEAARDRVAKRLLLAEAEVPSVSARRDAGAEDLQESVVSLVKVEVRRIRGANSTLMPPLNVGRVPRDSNVLTVTMHEALQLQLPAGLCLEIEIGVIDAAAQVVSLAMAAFAAAQPETSVDGRTTIFRGAYNPAAIGERIEAAIFTALDRAQTGIAGAIELGELKVA